MTLSRIAILIFLAQAASAPAPPATASVEGIVVKLGTSEPIAGADVELTRVEGTAAAPMTDEAIEAISAALVNGGNGTAVVPAALASEVRYEKTGPDGKFAFRNLKDGKYRLVAVRIGGLYQPAEYGQRDPSGRGLNFPVAPGQEVRNAKLEMAPTGIITGRIIDAEGKPVGHARVSALVPIVQNGRRYLTVRQTTHSDDHGEYRLFWLSPGRYYVAARLEDIQRRSVGVGTFPPGRSFSNEIASSPIVARRRLPGEDVIEETTGLVYFGGTLDPDQARSLEVRPGATFAAADITLGVGKQRAWHIRGSVVGSTGQPARGAVVVGVPRNWSPNVLVLRTNADANGVFDLSGAVQGSYALFATSNSPAPMSEEAAAAIAAAGIDPARAVNSVASELGYVPVDVGGADVAGIKIATTRGYAVSGRVVIEGRPLAEDDPDLRKMSVALTRDPNILMMPTPTIQLRPVEAFAEGRAPPPATTGPRRSGNGEVLGNGTFNFFATPGDFRVDVSGVPKDAYVKSIRMGNTDLLGGGLQISNPPENPLEIVIGTDGGEITGAVSNDRQEAMTNVIVALVPESSLLRRRFDLYRSTTTDHEGKFRLQTIPPGSYKLFSWEHVDSDAWQDAQFLQPYETFGRAISVREGSSQETQLKVIPIRR